ncbi:MAG: methyl-accepting chemotaxis protein [Proteobacteria bacterium]|nr:methyl-accepting chemotaxis protein [Pseudomonadota bacterium]MBU1737242.1 methyl-accepting chemotaxis protein [Pseudomonadota bacterium]
MESHTASCSAKIIGNIASFYSSVRSRKIPSSFADARKTCGIIQGLASLKESLAAVAKSHEPSFLKLGQNLQTIYMNANTLAGSTIESVKEISGDNRQSALAGLRDKIRISLARMAGDQAAIDNNLQDLETQGQHLSTLTNTSRDLYKIALYLKVAGINIGIEATRSEESRAMFSLTAEEVSQLGGRIISFAENIEEDASLARNVQLSVRADISRKLGKLREYGAAAETTVGNALAVIEQLLLSTSTAMDQAALHSKSIAAHCGEIVVGIQFHDSMSQRLEHVIETFAEAITLLADSPGEDPSQDPPLPLAERMAAAYPLCRLQANQIQQVVTEIESLHQQISRSFDLIDQIIGQMAAVLSGLSGDDREELSARHPGDSFENLKTSLDDLVLLMKQGDDLMEDVRREVHDAAETSNRLLSFMNKVNATAFEIKIQALNSIIKAAHLGNKGLTLVVLAHEINTLSDTADTIVAGAAEAYRLLSDQANKNLVNQGDAGRDDTSLSTAIADIESVYGRFKTTSQSVADKAEALRTLTRETRTSLDFLPGMAAHLNDCHRKMESLLSELEEECGPVGHETIDAAIRNVEGRYTMDQERVVHLQLTTGIPSEQSPIQADVSAEPDSSIELFSSQAEEDSSIELFGTDPEADSSVELFDAPPAAEKWEEPPIPSQESIEQNRPATEFSQPAEKKTEDLGDNVELF